MHASRKIIIAADSLAPGNGGIARVARLMAKSLSEESRHNYIDLEGLIYSDQSVAVDIRLRQQLAIKSKMKFVMMNQLNALTSDLFIYDFLGMARAHCLIPGLRKPFMSWIHGIEVWENARPVHIRLAKQATLLVSNSQYTLKRADMLHGPFPNARVCWLSTETDTPSDLDLPSKSCANVSIIGKIFKHCYKGHFPLIECWPEVVAKVPHARLQIIGDGPGICEVQSAIEKSPVANHIELKGFVPEDQMKEIWKQTKIFAMPSRGEGFGVVYIEAMRHGRPIIASIHDAAQEINIDGKTGFNVDLNVPGVLADRIVYLLKNHKKAVEMGINGVHRWKQHYSYSSFCRRFMPILNELTDYRSI